MKKNDSIILLVTAALLITMLLFPPFLDHSADGRIRNMGYSFMLKPPKKIADNSYADVNTGLLGIQAVIVTAVGGMLFFLYKSGNMEGLNTRNKKNRKKY